MNNKRYNTKEILVSPSRLRPNNATAFSICLHLNDINLTFLSGIDFVCTMCYDLGVHTEDTADTVLFKG